MKTFACWTEEEEDADRPWNGLWEIANSKTLLSSHFFPVQILMCPTRLDFQTGEFFKKSSREKTLKKSRNLSFSLHFAFLGYFRSLLAILIGNVLVVQWAERESCVVGKTQMGCGSKCAFTLQFYVSKQGMRFMCFAPSTVNINIDLEFK